MKDRLAEYAVLGVSIMAAWTWTMNVDQRLDRRDLEVQAAVDKIEELCTVVRSAVPEAGHMECDVDPYVDPSTTLD